MLSQCFAAKVYEVCPSLYILYVFLVPASVEMDAHLCSLCTSVVLYPQAQQLEDRHGRLLGYIELNCKTDCNVDTMRLRLMGGRKSRADASTYKAGNDASLVQSAPFQHFLVQEAMLFDVHTGKKLDLSGPRKFSTGKHACVQRSGHWLQ
jgi:hypothetical protein